MTAENKRDRSINGGKYMMDDYIYEDEIGTKIGKITIQVVYFEGMCYAHQPSSCSVAATETTLGVGDATLGLL